MLKRILIALAGMSLMLGLAAAPASGQAAEEVEMTVFSNTGFEDFSQDVAVPETSCTSISAGFPVLSVKNPNSPKTVLFYSEEGCDEADFVGQVIGFGENPALTAPATHFKSAS